MAVALPPRHAHNRLRLGQHCGIAGQRRPVYANGVRRAGSGYGLGSLLAERGVAAIARWLPFAISERELTHWLLNKMLRPQLIPSSRDDVLIEHAVAREALSPGGRRATHRAHDQL